MCRDDRDDRDHLVDVEAAGGRQDLRGPRPGNDSANSPDACERAAACSRESSGPTGETSAKYAVAVASRLAWLSRAPLARPAVPDV
jgi:hypothetical protein